MNFELPGYSIWVRAWHVEVGRIELFLLGIGGWRLLGALGIKPGVCHLNERHAAFAVLERARSLIEETGEPFGVALSITRGGNLFTTHTAVAAGFERVKPQLIKQYLGGYAELKLGVSRHDLLALGRANADDSSEKFNMTELAVRGSSAVNTVSRLHGEVTSWDSSEAEALWTESCEKDRWFGTTDYLSQDIRSVSNTELWQFHKHTRASLIHYARERLAQQTAASGASLAEVEVARRFATFKRATDGRAPQ